MFFLFFYFAVGSGEVSWALSLITSTNDKPSDDDDDDDCALLNKGNIVSEDKDGADDFDADRFPYEEEDDAEDDEKEDNDDVEDDEKEEDDDGAEDEDDIVMARAMASSSRSDRGYL